MASEEFDAYIRMALDQELHGKEVKRVYGVTCKGQAYVFVVTKVAWYGVYWFAQPEPVKSTQTSKKYGAFFSEWSGECLTYQQFVTLQGADNWISSVQRAVENPVTINDAKFLSFRIHGLPAACAHQPDTYLKPGDHIRGPFYADHHEAIYLGDGKVLHVSGHNDGGTLLGRKKAACARIGKFYGDFIHSYDAPVELVEYCLRLRTRKEIVDTAKAYAAEKFRNKEYNLF
ncbi:uncharacterized protein LOC129598472 [Paramacrobiotus metropolitanus]|uniref:uncharacterized protein LOC129598472 n=1 Tax=Paramacrobiotus metropolitanus TaxID=2943436 RepID=UPI002445D45C|nr:uncharacterized protein LOC129598472 [Paramacrobiotus metropolitanus]